MNAQIRNFSSTSLSTLALAGLAAACLTGALNAETIVVRSGQVGGNPGLVGQADDIVTYLPNNPPGGAISPNPFTAADFAGAVSGAAATVIQPYPVWASGLSDTQARWINWSMDAAGYGSPGSALYAVPFYVNTTGITQATISLEIAVDDGFGDWLYGGGNPDGLYVNGNSTGCQVGNYSTPSFFFGNITTSVTTGQNYLYFYQRDAGVLVSGLIFSATIDVQGIPTPPAAGMAGAGMMVLGVRRRRR
ncbi:MAG: hypothetical protein JNM07_11895 [Phycisphaerae bacterium]|nr:hypothetical protein [Phycisphaerae bacterium]